MTTYLHTARVCITIPRYTALTWAESRTKVLANSGYILTRHNLVVAQNTTLEEVSFKVNEYSVSENTLYRCVGCFSFDGISIFHNKHFGETIFCSKLMTHILTREHLVNDGWFYMKEIPRYVDINGHRVFDVKTKIKKLISCFLDRCHIFQRKNWK